MLKDITSILVRSHATLAQDLAGATALVFLLVAGLHLPGLI